MPKTELRADEPRKDCPFCGCLGKDLDTDALGINHECCGFVEWNEWNERPLEDALQADREMLHRLISKMRTDEAQTIEEVLEGVGELQDKLAAAEGLLDRRWFKAWAIIGDDGELLSREERGIGVIYGMDQAEIDDLIGDLWGGIEEMDLDVPCGAHCAEFIVKNPVHQEGQMSFPETGQWDFPPHWEMDIKVISYEVEDATILSRRTKGEG